MTNDTATPSSTKRSKIRVTLGAVGLALGGLAPLVTGIIGVWEYITKGYVISKTGELITGLSGVLMSVFFIIAGFAMMGYALWSYRRHRQRVA